MILALLLAATDPSVTLPLEKYAELTAAHPSAGAPPVAAVVSAQRLTARSEADGLLVEGHFAIDVLSDGWSKLCFLKLDPGTQVLELPRLDHVTVAPVAGELCAVSKTPGAYAFDVKLELRGNRLVAGKDALWSTVELDGDEVPLQAGGWTLTRRRPVVVVERPALEPTVKVARAELVSTVEGHAQLTLTYELELDRERPLSFTVPAGWSVDRVTVNGVARKGGLQLTVEPERDNAATVELRLSRELGVFHLSGQLDVELPRASWPVTELDAQVHLPQVFEYRRVGGSLEPSEAQPSSLPGRALGFRQHLIAASAPTLELEYSVDLKGRYFKTRP